MAAVCSQAEPPIALEPKGVAIGASAVASQAYSVGYAAGSYAMGAIYATLPGECSSPVVQGETYYLCGNTWFSPFFGANGISYRVVQTP